MNGIFAGIFRGVVLASVVGALPVATAFGQSVQPVRLYDICIERIIELEFEVPLEPFPVGCEVIDCCPGCPGPGPIDWRILVEGGNEATAYLEFENLHAGSRRLISESPSRWQSGERLLLTPGETRFEGLERDAEEPTVVTPVVRFDSSLAGKRPELRSREPVEEVKLVLEQLVAGVPVAERVVLVRLRWCDPPLVRADQLKLTQNRSADTAVVLVDAEDASGCFDDRGYTVVNRAWISNVLNPPPCPSEIAVFSDDDAVQLFEDVSDWTDATGDLFTGDLAEPRWEVPVSVWVAMPLPDRVMTANQAAIDMATADRIYNESHAGIGFLANDVYTTITDTTDIRVISDIAMNVWNTLSCTGLNAISGDATIHTAGQLNVYYVDRAFTGWYCPDSNIIAIGTNAQPASLAHEFGHAFSLGHTNNVDYDGDALNDFPNTNVMWGGGTGRTAFTEGQDFRMSINAESDLNENGVRTGVTRVCADATISTQCPWLGRDQ